MNREKGSGMAGGSYRERDGMTPERFFNMDDDGDWYDSSDKLDRIMFGMFLVDPSTSDDSPMRRMVLIKAMTTMRTMKTRAKWGMMRRFLWDSDEDVLVVEE